MKRTTLAISIATILGTAGLAGCGGGGGGSAATDTSGTTATTSVGTVTGFGSIYVNGIEYETGTTSYRVDDDDNDLEDKTGDDSALRVGMKVRVRGEVNDDRRTGRADSVFYDDDIEGPIQNLSLDTVAGTATFDIFGLAVFADAGTNFDGAATLAGLANGQIYEVSGNFDGSRLVATFLDPQDATETEFEVKGTVTAYDGAQVSIELINGATLPDLPISGSAIIEVSSPVVGRFVELKLNAAGDVIKIENDDRDLLDDDDNGNEIEVSGVLADDGAGGFTLNGMPLVLTGTTEYDPPSLEGSLAAGTFVKVHARKDGDSLVVREIETEEGEIEIDGVIDSVNATGAKTGTVTVDVGAGLLTVSFDASAMYDDNSDMDTDDDGSFDLTELGTGEFVEIEASLEGNGLAATSIRREKDADDARVKAPVESWVSDVSVTLLGLTWNVQNGTQYEVEDLPTTPQEFFNKLQDFGAGTELKVKDDRTADGSADELDLDDPSN